MGLGPVVCPSCLVFAEVEDLPQPEWLCPVCGSEALDYLWLFNEQEQKTIVRNSKFIRFVQGKE